MPSNIVIAAENNTAIILKEKARNLSIRLFDENSFISDVTSFSNHSIFLSIILTKVIKN